MTDPTSTSSTASASAVEAQAAVAPSLLRLLRPRHWAVIGCAIALQLGDGFDLVAMSFAAPPVARQLALSHVRLGILLSAAQLGSLAGAALVAAAAARVPRKYALATAAATVGVGSLITAASTTFQAFLASRILTGVGLGAILPLVVTYAVGLTPPRARGGVTGLAMSAQMAGSMIAGVFSAMLLPALGWPALFLAGAAVPLLLAATIAALPHLPDDLRGLGRPEIEVEALRSRYGLAAAPRDGPAPSQARVARARPSAVLALVFATSAASLVGYFIVSWTPSLLQMNGLGPGAAALSSSFFSAGAIVGVLACGRLMDRWSPYWVIGLAALAAELPLLVLAWSKASPGEIFTLYGLMGATVMGSVASNVGFASLMFPPGWRIRTTALVSWLSRMAGLIAPAGAGFLLSRTTGPRGVFTLCAWLLLVAALAMILPGLRARRGHWD